MRNIPGYKVTSYYYWERYPAIHRAHDRPFTFSAKREDVRQRTELVKPAKIIPQENHYVESQEENNDSCCTFKCYSKVSRATVTATSIGLFLYLAVAFLQMYTEYLTSVDVFVEFPNAPQMPAITVCSSNLYRKSSLCKIRPDVCTALQMFTNTTDILKNFTRRTDANVLREISHQEAKFFRSCRILSESNPRNYSGCREPFWFFLMGRPCFVMDSEWNYLVEKAPKKNDTAFEMILDLEPHEYIDPTMKPSAEVYIHSRQEIPDSRSEHFPARGGRVYEIGITSVVMLEPPYVTMCKNYTKEYIKLHPDDSRSPKKDPAQRKPQESGDTALGETVCETSCRTKAAIKQYKCVPQCLPFHPDTPKCVSAPQAQKRMCNDLKDEREQCFENCPVECEVELYDMELDEDVGFTVTSEDESSETNGTAEAPTSSTQTNDYTRVTINLELIRHVMYVHRAKITPIEILGYIGGYLGIFLGISVPMLYDTILYVFSFSVEFVRRRGHSLRHRLQLD